MAKRCVPGIAKWSVYAGGTACPDRARGYSYHVNAYGNYKVDPVCRFGRLTGYAARFENIKGVVKTPGLHQDLNSDGWPGFGGRTTFRSPAQAANAANAHCLLVDKGLAGSRRRRRR